MLYYRMLHVALSLVNCVKINYVACFKHYRKYMSMSDGGVESLTQLLFVLSVHPYGLDIHFTYDFEGQSCFFITIINRLKLYDWHLGCSLVQINRFTLNLHN